MPLLGFTKLLDKLLDGSKTQTIRVPRKHPLKVGDRLFIYWGLRTKKCWKMGEAVITHIQQKRLVMVTNNEWVRDGFPDGFTGYILFSEMHPNLHPADYVDIITFEWTQHKAEFIKQRVELREIPVSTHGGKGE